MKEIVFDVLTGVRSEIKTDEPIVNLLPEEKEPSLDERVKAVEEAMLLLMDLGVM